MKTTKIALVLLAVCMQLGIMAQDSNIDWGTQVSAGGTDNAYIPMGWVDGKFYTIQIDGKEGSLLTIKDNMDLESQKVILTGQKKFETDMMFVYDGKIQMLYSEFEASEKTNYVRANSFTLLNKPGGMKLKKVAAVKVEANSEKSDFNYFLSQDSSTILIMHVYDMGNKDNAKVALQVANVKEEMAPVWDATVTLPYISKEFKVLTAAVNNAGQVIVVGAKRIERSKGDTFYETHVISFPKNSDDFEDKIVDLGNKYVSSIRAQFISDDELMVAGFYIEKEQNGSSTGLTGGFIEILSPGKFLGGDQLTREIDADVKDAITPSSGLAKLFGADELDNYSIQDMVLNPDGSGYVIAEQRYVIQSVESNMVTRTYYFNHLLAFRFDEKQEITWFSSVPKQQVTSVATPKLGPFWIWTGNMTRLGYKYNSYTAVEKEGKLYLLYNDHKKNGEARTLRETNTMSNKNTALATLVTIDENGEWTKEALFRGKDLDAILETSSSWPIPGVGFTISAEKGKDLQYGRLTLE
jgi:hypothetical protein